MVLPRTKPLDGEFWYILDDQGQVEWRPCPNLRGDFYLGWLGQNRNVVGAGLIWLQQGHITHLCTHGTPYYWLQPYEVLPFTAQTLQAQQVPGADTMALDYSLAGWGFRDQTSPPTRAWPEASIPEEKLRPLLTRAIRLIVRNFRSEGEPPPAPESEGLLARMTPETPPDPLQTLLDQLRESLGEPFVLPILIELIRHDINVMPNYRQSDLFESLSSQGGFPPPSKVARLVLSAVYHLGPMLGNPRLSQNLLLNSLRQRHPFDVTWGAGFLVKCVGMSNLVRLLQAAMAKEKDDQIRGNALDLLQECGYGAGVGLAEEVLHNLTRSFNQESGGAFGQVLNSHLSFLQEHMRQREAARSVD